MSLFDLVEKRDIFHRENDTVNETTDESVVSFTDLLIRKGEELMRKKEEKEEKEEEREKEEDVVKTLIESLPDNLTDYLSSLLHTFFPKKALEELIENLKNNPEDAIVSVDSGATLHSESIARHESETDLIYDSSVSIIQTEYQQPTPEQLARLAEHFGK